LEKRQLHRRGDEPTRGVFPRWPAAVELLAIGALYTVLSDGLTLGPRAFLLGLVAVLLVPLMSAHLRGSHRLARWFGLGMVGLPQRPLPPSRTPREHRRIARCLS
jgi:hypothetical protein